MTPTRPVSPINSAPTIDQIYEGRWLSIRQIAADLSVSTSTAYKWSARGEPFFPRTIRLGNGDIRVRRDWYERWLEGLRNNG